MGKEQNVPTQTSPHLPPPQGGRWGEVCVGTNRINEQIIKINNQINRLQNIKGLIQVYIRLNRGNELIQKEF